MGALPDRRDQRLDEVIEQGRISSEWVGHRRKQWGSTSAVFINRVLGEFADSESDGVIPLAWVEAAMDRWHKARLEVGEDIPVTIGADAEVPDRRMLPTSRR